MIPTITLRFGQALYIPNTFTFLCPGPDYMHRIPEEGFEGLVNSCYGSAVSNYLNLKMLGTRGGAKGLA